MPYYNVFFRYVDGNNKLHSNHTRVDADNQADAKKRVISGERKHFGRIIAVDKVKRV